MVFFLLLGIFQPQSRCCLFLQNRLSVPHWRRVHLQLSHTSAFQIRRKTLVTQTHGGWWKLLIKYKTHRWLWKWLWVLHIFPRWNIHFPGSNVLELLFLSAWRIITWQLVASLHAAVKYSKVQLKVHTWNTPSTVLWGENSHLSVSLSGFSPIST